MTEWCVDGRLMRDVPPTWDEPVGDVEDIGECPHCNGIGCEELPSIEAQAEIDEALEKRC